MSDNEVEVVVKGTDDSKKAFDSAENNADKLGDALKKVGKEADKSLKDVDKAAKKTGDGLKDVGDKATKTGASLGAAGDKGKESGHKIGGAFKEKASEGLSSFSDKLGPAGGLLSKLGPIGLGVGATIAAGLAVATAAVAALTAATKASIERSQVGALAGAQGGGTDPTRIAQLGKIAGKVYADNFGESLQEAGNAVRDVIRNHLLPESATDEAVAKASEKLLTLGTVVEADASEVARSVKTLLNTGLVKTADEAFDLIATGAQSGLNVAGDLLDTLNEYPTQFRKLGLDAQTALGLLSQGLKNGARDSDIVADALKEFSIRAVDGSASTADGFKRLGLNAKQMAADIAAGGPKATAALDQTLDRLRAVKDPVKQAQIAVELFGTQAEDLGKALYSLDPSSAVAALGKVQGAADKASTALGSNLGASLETIQRKIQNFGADVGDEIAPGIQKIIDQADKLGGRLEKIFSGSAVPQELKDSLREVGEKYGPAVEHAFSNIGDAIERNKPELEELGHFIANDLIPFFGTGLVLSISLAGGALSGIVSVVGGVVDAFDYLKRVGSEAALALLNIFLYALYGIAQAAYGAFAWVPGLGDKLKEARDKVKEYVDKINDEIGRIHNKDININVYYNYHTRGQSLNAPLRTGGIPHRAAGGGSDGLTVINEDGQEAVRLPTGSIVYPTANANQMRAAGGGVARVLVELKITGSGALYEVLHQAQRAGDLQILDTAIVAA